MNVPSTSPPKEASHASLVFTGQTRVRYFLNTPCSTTTNNTFSEKGTDILVDEIYVFIVLSSFDGLQ
jgi:hypothetical protein